jgi:hypothetical protein
MRGLVFGFQEKPAAYKESGYDNNVKQPEDDHQNKNKTRNPSSLLEVDKNGFLEKDNGYKEETTN